MNRTELALAHLTEEWDTVVVLCSQYDGTQTEAMRFSQGNGFAVQQMIEDELDTFICESGGDYGEEEED